MKRFTAEKNLLGMEKICHEIMKRNELIAGKNAYELSWAATSNSGPSFGGNQMDISSNEHARRVLLDIVNNAWDINGQPIFTRQNKGDIERKLAKPEGLKGIEPEDLFGKPIFNKINAALSSAYGIYKTNEAYLFEIQSGIRRVEQIVQDISHPQAKKFYNTLYGKALLFDYHNQFNLAKGGPMNKYINGEEVTLNPNNGPHTTFSKRDINESYTFKDHKKFLLSTQYGIGKPNDIERRLNNINDYFKKTFNFDNEMDLLKMSEVNAQIELKIQPDIKQNASPSYNSCIKKYDKAVFDIMKSSKKDEATAKQYIAEDLPKIVANPVSATFMPYSAYITPLFGCYNELKGELSPPTYHDEL